MCIRDRLGKGRSPCAAYASNGYVLNVVVSNFGVTVMVAIPKENWSGKIKEVAFGATDDEGGTRDRKLRLGGETTLPFLAFAGAVSRPAIGMEAVSYTHLRAHETKAKLVC